MKNAYFKLSVVVLTLLISIFSLLVPDCYSQWVRSSNGITGRDVLSFTTNGNRLFAGVYEYGTYETTDNGSSWTNLVAPTADALATNGNFLFVGTRFDVYKSPDLGNTWSQTHIPCAQPYIESIALNGSYIFVGSLLGMFFSSDFGGSWVQLTFASVPFPSILINGNHILAGTGYQGAYSSTDNGASWVHTLLDTQSVFALVQSGNEIYAGTSSGVYKSVNNGVSWIQTSLNNVRVNSLAVTGSSVFAGSYLHGAYVSNDNGVTWFQRNEGFGNFDVTAMTILNNYVFAGTYGDTVYRRSLSELTGIQPVSSNVPSHFSLSQNYPNPFNPNTKFKIEIAKSSFTQVTVFDVLGREVATLVNQQLQPGTYEVNLDGTRFASGVYFYTLKTDGFTDTKRMIIIK